jgi:hypothetical protein
MSIHRPKRASSRRSDAPTSVTGRGSSSSGPPKPPKWKEAVADKPDAVFAPYSPTHTFARDALVSHSKFGKGIVVDVDGNKVHVLFEEGVRKLLQGTPG